MISIAIDGPAGAGKTTIAKRVAKKLNLVYVDTGAFYRTVAVAIQRNGWKLDNISEELLQTIKLDVQLMDGVQRMLLGGEDVTALLRTPEISKLASDSSALPVVRIFLLKTQQDLAQRTSVIMEGRDIGTVVLPDATLKVFMTADLDVRAERRMKELNDSRYTFEDVRSAMVARDQNDSTRKIAPLQQADDAYYLNTSKMSLEEVEERILEFLDCQLETTRLCKGVLCK